MIKSYAENLQRALSSLYTDDERRQSIISKLGVSMATKTKKTYKTPRRTSTRPVPKRGSQIKNGVYKQQP